MCVNKSHVLAIPIREEMNPIRINSVAIHSVREISNNLVVVVHNNFCSSTKWCDSRAYEWKTQTEQTKQHRLCVCVCLCKEKRSASFARFHSHVSITQVVNTYRYRKQAHTNTNSIDCKRILYVPPAIRIIVTFYLNQFSR